MPLWCTNRSLPWSSGVMKPKPLSSLNHFTVPVAILLPLQEARCGERRRFVLQLLRNAGTVLHRAHRPALTTIAVGSARRTPREVVVGLAFLLLPARHPGGVARQALAPAAGVRRLVALGNTLLGGLP